MRFNQPKFLELMEQYDVVGFFEEHVILNSGILSHWYVNWRTVLNDVYGIDQVSNHLLSVIQDYHIEFDSIYGVPEGATKLGIVTQYKWARNSSGFGPGSHSLPMGRGQKKEHGKIEDREFLGKPKGNVIVIEDVTTTGSSIFETIKKLIEVGARATAVITLTDRLVLDSNDKTVKEILRRSSIPFYALSTAEQILPEAIRRKNPSSKVVNAIRQEFTSI
jgi:orotate phosphoribosyltransferase